jgi:hypothetical protein
VSFEVEKNIEYIILGRRRGDRGRILRYYRGKK